MLGFLWWVVFRWLGRSSFGARTLARHHLIMNVLQQLLYISALHFSLKSTTTLLHVRCSRKPEKVLEILNAAEIRRQPFANLSLIGESPWAATLHPCIAIKLICADVLL